MSISRAKRSGGWRSDPLPMTLATEDTRARLLDVTHALMEEGGAAAVKARTVAAAVGISVGSVYNLFGSIDGLVQAANADVMSEFAEDLRDTLGAIAADASLRERLTTMAGAYMDFMDKRGPRWIALLEYNRDRTTDEMSTAYEEREAELLTSLAQALGGSDLDTDDATRAAAARMLWSGMHGIVSLNYLGFENEATRKRTERLVDLYVTLVVRGAATGDAIRV